MQVPAVEKHDPVSCRVCQPALGCQRPAQHLVSHQGGPAHPFLLHTYTAAGLPRTTRPTAAAANSTAAEACSCSTVAVATAWLALCWAGVVRQVHDGGDDGVPHPALTLVVAVKVQLVACNQRTAGAHHTTMMLLRGTAAHMEPANPASPELCRRLCAQNSANLASAKSGKYCLPSACR